MFEQFLSIDAVERLGTNFAFVLLMFWYMVQQGKKQDKQSSKYISIQEKQGRDFLMALDKITESIGRTFLSKAQVFTMLNMCFKLHILRKLDLVRKILDDNDIVNRQEQIKTNIRCNFIEISRSEAAQLNEYNTEIGKIGDILLSQINWNTFLESVYKIVFDSELKKELKIKDLKTLMEQYVSDIMVHYEDLYCPEKKKESFIQGLKQEMSKVSWTSKKELKTLTKTVLLSTVFFGLGIYAVDLVIKQCLFGIHALARLVFGA